MMTNEQKKALDGKVVCGAAGEPMEVLDISYGPGLRKDSVELRLEMKAKEVLLNPNNTNAGTDPIEEELLVTYGVDLDAPDKKLFYQTLNETFNLQPPLDDVREEDGSEPHLMRFAQEHPESVYPQIVGNKLFARLKVKWEPGTKYDALITAYPTKPKTQNSAGSGLMDFLKKRDADKAAALAKKKAEEAEIFG